MKLDELKQLAQAATPGPWVAEDWHQNDGPDKSTIVSLVPEIVYPGQSYLWPDGISHKQVADTGAGYNPLSNAAYIAAISPERILAMIECIEAADAMRAEVYQTYNGSEDRTYEYVDIPSQTGRAYDAARAKLNAME